MSTSARSRLVLRGVVSEGLPAAAANAAEREIRTVFAIAEHCAAVMERRAEVSVRITADLEAAVDRFNHEHGLFGSPYSRKRPCSEASGIVLTVPSDANDARHVIVVDASLWPNRSSEHVVLRTMSLACLIGRLINLHDPGLQEPGEAVSSGEHARDLRRRALALSSEHVASIAGASICGVCLRDLNGNPVRIADHAGPGLLQMASDLLGQLSVFATLDLPIYRVHSIGFEDLYPTAMDLTDSLLRCAVQLIALFHVENRTVDLRRELVGLNGYSAFLEPVWDHVVEGCTTPQRSVQVQSFSAALIELLSRLGLRAEDQEDGGVYLHVHEPTSCSWDDPAADTE